MNNELYKNYTVQAHAIEETKQSYIVEKAVVFEFESVILHYTADALKPIIYDVLKRFPDARGELHEVVLMSRDKVKPFRVPTKILVPADMQLLSEIQKHMQSEFSNRDPKSFVLKRNFDCITKPKPPAKAKSRVQKADAGIPPVDLSKVPDKLIFMTTEGFKDAAKVFYCDLILVQPTSDRGWVKRRFVDGLDTWPHIKRADDALDGLISKALTIVAENPHFPPWWRSIGVCLLRGNPINLIRQCESVLSHTSINKPVFESDIVDKNFDDRRDVRLNVITEEPLLIEVECPPSLPLDLWDRIPVDQREEALVEMAYGLRAGVHPIETVEKSFLK